MRDQFGAEIVSWWTTHNTPEEVTEESIDHMREAGYLSSNREELFFRQYVVGRDPFEVLRQSHPVIVTVRPGFGENRDKHSIILADVKGEGIEVIDPDERNAINIYPEAKIRNYLDPEGACSVILPRAGQ
jgi:hypothetical protein